MAGFWYGGCRGLLVVSGFLVISGCLLGGLPLRVLMLTCLLFCYSVFFYFITLAIGGFWGVVDFLMFGF